MSRPFSKYAEYIASSTGPLARVAVVGQDDAVRKAGVGRLGHARVVDGEPDLRGDRLGACERHLVDRCLAAEDLGVVRASAKPSGGSARLSW